MNNSVDNVDDTEIESPINDFQTKYTNLEGEETIEKIPLFGENFDITKRTEETQLILTKKWITSTKKIEIPIKYEEMLIDGKEFDSYNENEITEIFSKIKHKITEVFLHEKNKDSEDKQQIHDDQHNQSNDIEIREYKEQSNKDNQNQNEINEKLVPFSLDNKNDDISNNKEENVIPLWGEEIIIDKKMVKLGEVIIKKYKTTDNQKIEIDVKTEKITIKYPDNHKEEII
jgi:stress response protein YsnF